MTSARDKILKPLAAATFLIFFNGYLVAPLIPALASEFHVGIQQMGWVVPAYMLTYGCSTLIYGPLSDRLGRGPVLLTLLFLFAAATAGMPFVTSFPALITMRVVSGLCAGGILPIALALIGDLYPYAELGRPMGWMFGAVAGGVSFGSTFGAWLNPTLGWRREFAVLAGANLIVMLAVLRERKTLNAGGGAKRTLKQVASGYLGIFAMPRAAGTYSLIFFNAVFHSGVFSWLGYYLIQRHSLDDAGIGKALLGYGVPGMFLGPTIGKLADRYGRRRIIPIGFAVAAVCALLLAPSTPLVFAVLVITVLSAGFDMSHPLMAGVVTTLDPARRGQAMGLNAFAVFVGFGIGSIAFQVLMKSGLGAALAVFGVAELAFGFAAIRVFNAERRKPLAAAG
jgi:predicted MFS family arabinose efflux permease